jgi:hypothetical protein
MTLQQMIDDKISLLREQINPTNKPELNSTFQIQEDAIRSAAQDLERVESIIAQKKGLLKNSKDMQETDRLLAELDALEWLREQMAVFYSRNQR